MKYDNDYAIALHTAGAKIHAFEEFGSYQGDWWAKVTYKGETGWVNGSYGSCSGCDAFQGEFGYGSHQHEDGSLIYSTDIDKFKSSCVNCQDYKKRLIEFAENGYLDNILTAGEAIKQAGEYVWDSESQKMVEYIKNIEDSTA